MTSKPLYWVVFTGVQSQLVRLQNSCCKGLRDTAGGTSHRAAAWMTSPSALPPAPGLARPRQGSRLKAPSPGSSGDPRASSLCWAVPAGVDLLPPTLGAALSLGSWFQRLLCVVEEGELNSAPQYSLCRVIIRLQATYNLSSSSSQSLKLHFAPAPRFVPLRQRA